ncbi:MAG TPA: DUF805 domain-containing protein [Cyclobacteriaceae bacterium]|nr:DUF805 domain-containing protein [Cyclobacteriaceae bacterium]
MFKNPFSFSGRIRRMEYGLTFIIYIVAYVASLALIGAAAPIGILVLIPLIWFVWAQGAKRCHDIGRTGWMQIVPFYVLFLLFQDGDDGTNSYGQNPKYPDQMDVLDSETLDGHLKD